MESVRFIVRGKVQGVGYRRFVQKQAQALGLSGWTRNLSDGAVEVMVAAKEAGIAALAEQLHKGPSFSQVDEVKLFAGQTVNHSGFEILPDGEV